MLEVWKYIPGSGQNYQISDMGRVRTLDRITVDKRNFSRRLKGKMLKPTILSHGYTQVSIYPPGKKFKKSVHRLVCESFLDNPENKPQINHINAIKTDNRLSNLEWCTAKENDDHARKNNLTPPMPRGKNSPLYKGDIIATEIKTGNVIVICGQNGLAEYGFHPRDVNKCLKGSARKHHGHTFTRSLTGE